MTGKTHQILGATAGLTYLISTANPIYNPATFGAVLVFSYIGALLPDIDQPTGKLWHYLPFGDSVAKIPTKFLEHRNITHSILGVCLVAAVFHILFKPFPSYWGINTQVVFVCTIISYMSHLLADMFTNEGIPLLFPYHRFFGLPPKPFDGFRVATGKWFENLIIFPCLTFYLIIFVISNLNDLKKILFK